MPRLEEVGYYMRGLWLLLMGKAEGFYYLDFTERGFWRSWWAILFCLPPTLLNWASFRLYFLSQAPSGTSTGPGFFVKLAVVEAASWLVPLLAVLTVTRVASLGYAALPLVIAFNWLAIPLQWAFVPISLLQIWAPAESSGSLFYLFTLGSYVFVSYRIAVAILAGQKFPALVLIMVVVTVPLMVQSQLLSALGLIEL